MILETILAISLILNIGLVLYAGVAARRLYTVLVNMESLKQVFKSFQDHVQNIHESEMFYGDQTLQTLIEHSKDVLEELSAYDDITALVYDEEELQEDAS
tara:strand:- start:91 stop:390 length:300 start_codon:yes stop_codon:yes gene_type:complete